MSIANAVVPASHADLLERPVLAHVATIGPAGEPQNNPVWFGWDGEYLRFSQTTGRQKYRNVASEPRVALSIVDPQNPYRYLEVRGKIVESTEEGAVEHIESLSQRYTGKPYYKDGRPPAGETRVTFKIEPTRVLSR